MDRFILGDSAVRDLLINRVRCHLDLIRTVGKTSQHTSGAVLELPVCGGVDERVDTAVGKAQHISEVVEPVNDVQLIMRMYLRAVVTGRKEISVSVVRKCTRQYFVNECKCQT